MVRDFPKSANQPNEMALTISSSVSCYCFPLMRDWNWEIVQMVRKFLTFRSERKKRTTSGGSSQFPNGFSGKLLFHLTFNRNFRIFWLNGKHPRGTPLFFRSEWNVGNFLTIYTISQFQSPITENNRKLSYKMVSAISFGWFADFGKSLTIIQRSS